MELLALAQRVLIHAPPVIFAITLHEAAHGWVASRLGDQTARDAGRLSLNPLRHVDPVGTVLVPLVTLILGGLLFGWAKPVPVRASRLRQPRRDMALVALAGPAANLLMGIFWALVVKLAVVYHTAPGLPGSALLAPLAGVLFAMGLAGILINTILLVLNLLPLPPLDGGRVLVSMLPPPAARLVERIEPFGLVILVVLLFTGTLGALLAPPVGAVESLLMWLSGVHGRLF